MAVKWVVLQEHGLNYASVHSMAHMKVNLKASMKAAKKGSPRVGKLE